MAPLLATILRRLVMGLPALFGVVVVSFALTRLLPGDPAVYFAGAAPTREAIADLRRTLLLDRPLPQQFAAYLGDLLHGNLGRSLVTGQPVLQDLSTRFPATLELTLTAIALALLIAVPLGVAGAMRKGSSIDHIARMVATTAHPSEANSFAVARPRPEELPVIKMIWRWGVLITSYLRQLVKQPLSHKRPPPNIARLPQPRPL